MYKTVIFDFNGTLLDDCDCCLKILNLLTKEYGLGYVSKEHYKSIFTFPVYEYYQSLGFDVSFDSSTFVLTTKSQFIVCLFVLRKPIVLSCSVVSMRNNVFFK